MPISLSTQQIQKQIMAPSMQQSIEALLLPLTDLNLLIEQELQENPLLEIVEEDLDGSQTSLDEEMRKQLERYDNIPQVENAMTSDDEVNEERTFKNESNMEESLLRQLHIELSDPLDIQIGEFIIGNLSEDGYLQVNSEEIAKELGLTETARIEYVLNIIQNFDPIGIASHSLQECLLAQAKAKCNSAQDIVYRIIEECLSELAHKRYLEIARKLKASVEDVKKAARIIASLDPRPARNYRPISPNIYIKPDVFIVQNDDGYQVVINDDGIPPLRISPMYKNMLNKRDLNIHERDFIKERLRNALNFIKSLEQRGQTIRAIAEYILEKQKTFFENDSDYLYPMTLKDVAHVLDRNESTISRAINDKYIDTPKGVFPLKFFFSQGIPEKNNGAIASRSIKEKIRDLVDSENKFSPLSDQDIQNYFNENGMHIARRTISKYRQALNILPSHLRKE